MKYIITFLILLTQLSGLVADDNDEIYSNYWIKTSFGGNMNLHSSAFTELPGTDTLAFELNNSFTSSYYVNVGLEYLLKSKPFGMESKYSISIGMSSLKGDFSKTGFIGYDISEDSYVEANSIQKLLTKLDYVTINQNLFFNLFDDIPFSTGFGFSILFPMTTSFEQSEHLSALSGTSFENGKEVRNEKSGELKKMEAYNIALNLSMRYRAYSWNNIDLFADVAYSLPLLGLNEVEEWNVSSAKAGFTLAYRTKKTQKKIPVEPITPVLPLPPLPPAPEPLVLSQYVYHNNVSIKNNQSIYLDMEAKEYFEDYKLQPFIFYENNNITYLSGNDRNLTAIEKSAKMEMLLSVIKYLNSNPEINVTIRTFNNYPEKITSERISLIRSEIVGAGIKAERVKEDKVNLNFDELKYDELKEEYNRVEFVFSNGVSLVPYSFTQKTIYDISSLDLLVSLESNYDDNNLYSNEVLLNGSSINKSNKDKFIQTLDNSISDGFNFRGKNSLKITSTLTNKENIKQKSTNINMMPNIVKRDTIRNIIKLNSGDQVQQYVAAYFDFDSAELDVYNRELIEKINEAISDNKKVIILPLTDNLGDQEHNKALAKKRARNYLKLFTENSHKLEIEYPDGFIFSNEHPYGRMLNRSIIVRIYND